MITKIATQAVYVEDQAAGLQFWTEKVGFEVRFEAEMGPNTKWIEVGPPDGESHLVIYPKTMMEDWAERKPSIVFACDDIHSTYEAMAGRGVEFTMEPREMPWAWFAIFIDEDGNWYGLREGA